MRCEVCEQRKVKCSLNTGERMSLRQCMKEGRPAKLTETATSYIYHPTNIPSWEYTPSPPHTRPPPLDRQQLSTPQATIDTIRNRKAQQAPAGARQTRSMTRQHEVESESEDEIEEVPAPAPRPPMSSQRPYVQLPPSLPHLHQHIYHLPPPAMRAAHSNPSSPAASTLVPSTQAATRPAAPGSIARHASATTNPSPSSSSSYRPVLSPGYQTPPRPSQNPTSPSHPTTATSLSPQRLSQLGTPLSPSHYNTTPPSRPTPSSATGSPESRDPDNVRFALPAVPRPPLGRLMNAPRQMSAPRRLLHPVTRTEARTP